VEDRSEKRGIRPTPKTDQMEKKKEQRSNETKKREEMIEELCDDVYLFQSKANFTARRNKL
jgi:hypothetical protein